MWITSSLTTIQSPTLVALGNFDGLHRGHRQVIQPILTGPLPPDSSEWSPTERQCQCDYSDRASERDDVPHLYSTVVTFHPHPQAFFSGQRRLLLTPLDEKVSCLKKMGVEQLVLLPFDRALAELSPQDFVENILVKHLQARQISVGQDFCFGRKRSGTTADLKAIAAQHHIAVHVVPLYTCEGDRISSSAIRQALQHGKLDQANRLLGRPYTLVGEVIGGQQLGRTIGFPTANLKLPSEKFLPRDGVYCVWVQDAECKEVQSLPGVMNIGRRPTVDGLQQTIEVHLLDWAGDLYGHTLTVHLEKFVRPEQKFSSLEALKAQIETDCAIARSWFAASPQA